MENLTFEQLPQAVTQIFDKLETIERLLNNKPAAITQEADKVLTIKEAAELLHLAVPTLYNYVQNKSIPFSKRSKKLYFSKKELEEWVKLGRQRTNAEIISEAKTFLNAKRKK